MKFRYFLRGLGAGIVFSAIIFVIAYNSKGTEISDEEIIRRAKNLGMTESQDQIGALLEERTDEQTSQGKEEAEQKNTEQKTKEDTKTTETGTKNSDTGQTEKPTTEEVKQESVELVVTSGMSSYPVCQKLQELGLIDNAEEFDDFLIEKGYASKISVGTHTLKKGMTKEEIAYAISDK